MPPRRLGEEIRRCRAKAGSTLRAFARDLGISAAHQSDIEHSRRMPSEELLRKTARKLVHVGASYEEFKRLDPRLEPDLAEWIQKTPEVRQLLREARSSGKTAKQMLREFRESLKREEEGDR